MSTTAEIIIATSTKWDARIFAIIECGVATPLTLRRLAQRTLEGHKNQTARLAELMGETATVAICHRINTIAYELLNAEERAYDLAKCDEEPPQDIDLFAEIFD